MVAIRPVDMIRRRNVANLRVNNEGRYRGSGKRRANFSLVLCVSLPILYCFLFNRLPMDVEVIATNMVSQVPQSSKQPFEAYLVLRMNFFSVGLESCSVEKDKRLCLRSKPSHHAPRTSIIIYQNRINIPMW